MQNNSIVSLKMTFIWMEEQPVLDAFFNAIENLGTHELAEIVLDYTLSGVNTSIGLLKTVLPDNRTMRIEYKEKVDVTISNNLPIWKHKTFVDMVKAYLQDIHEKNPLLFTGANTPSCKIECFNTSDLDILDESGVIIKGPYSSMGVGKFDVAKGFDAAINEFLMKSLSSFQKYIPEIK